MVTERLEEEKRHGNLNHEYIILQAAYNKKSFRLYSVAFTPSIDDQIGSDLASDNYYNLVLVLKSTDDVVGKFRNIYLFRFAYEDVGFALYEAYQRVLR